MCYNAVDRHVENGLGDHPAIIYDGPITGKGNRIITYKELQQEVGIYTLSSHSLFINLIWNVRLKVLGIFENILHILSMHIIDHAIGILYQNSETFYSTQTHLYVCWVYKDKMVVWSGRLPLTWLRPNTVTIYEWLKLLINLWSCNYTLCHLQVHIIATVYRFQISSTIIFASL